MEGEAADAKGGTESFSSMVYGDGVSVEECQEMIQRSLRTPMVRFLMENLEKSGCSIGDNFIKAVDCKRKLSGGYVRGGGIMLRGHEQDCVKRRVMKSVMANPHCSETAAKDAMEAVWETCYNDTRPFDRAP
uniref:Mitochondrial inner membrane protease ATP23 n=1 Tax=Chenopodium quinoa TaxID=63459 RepID=A0A803N6E9_CHEQI